MKERSGKDSKVEFQSGATKKSAPVATPRPRPKSVGKTYTNPPVNKMSDQQIRAGNYTLRTINPNALPKKTQSTAPLSGKQKRMEKGRSRLNPFIIYGETKKKKPKSTWLVVVKLDSHG